MNRSSQGISKFQETMLCANEWQKDSLRQIGELACSQRQADRGSKRAYNFLFIGASNII